MKGVSGLGSVLRAAGAVAAPPAQLARPARRFASRRPATEAIHAGEDHRAGHKASAPDICVSTTFSVDRLVSFDAAAQPDEAAYVYTRWGNPTIAALEAKLCALEGAEAGLAFASGMAASTAVLLGGLSAGDHCVASEIAYPGTAELLRNTLPRLGIAVSLVDSSRLDEVQAALRPETKMIWVETPANPILRLTDIAGVARLAPPGCAVAVDSTFGTPVATRPLELGADLVVHSLTKYIGGHGDALGGAVLGRSGEMVRRLSDEASIHFGATISVRGDAVKLAEAMMGPDGLQLIHYAVSLGHHRSLIFLIETAEVMRTSFRLEGQAEMKRCEERYRAVAGDGVFRFSVGLEDADDLIEDLGSVLDKHTVS